jgi:hypothetical protein
LFPFFFVLFFVGALSPPPPYTAFRFRTTGELK